MAVLEGLEPARFFYYFEQLTRIPRGSGNEKAASDYVVNFAREHGFRWEQDAANNVKIWAPATPGYEDRKTIALQAHLDMVCASAPGVDFDFKTQPLDIYVEDGFIKARGTTLGADNGVGVAMILTLLEREDLPHPPLQAIFTTGEEILFVGAQAMADDWIDSDYMIGLDYSNNKSILAAAAGMSTVTCDCQLDRRPLSAGADTVVEIELTGLQGGHSGNMIHRDRANAIKVMGELLSAMREKFPQAELVSYTGGTLINVICYRSAAAIACPAGDVEAMNAFLRAQTELICRAYSHTEPHMEFAIRTRPASAGDTAIDPQRVGQLLDFVALCFAGAYMMVDDAYTRAESSANLGVLEEIDGLARITISMRSNVAYHFDQMIDQKMKLARLCGLTPTLRSKFGAWEFVPDSKLLEQTKVFYQQVFGVEANVAQIHAGVEGGVFQEKAQRTGRKVDLINLGCMNYDVHTPKERLEIASVKPTYELLCKILSEVQ